MGSKVNFLFKPFLLVSDCEKFKTIFFLINFKLQGPKSNLVLIKN